MECGGRTVQKSQIQESEHLPCFHKRNRANWLEEAPQPASAPQGRPFFEANKWNSNQQQQGGRKGDALNHELRRRHVLRVLPQTPRACATTDGGTGIQGTTAAPTHKGEWGKRGAARSSCRVGGGRSHTMGTENHQGRTTTQVEKEATTTTTSGKTRREMPPRT